MASSNIKKNTSNSSNLGEAGSRPEFRRGGKSKCPFPKLSQSRIVNLMDRGQVKYWATIQPTIRTRIMAEYQIFFK